VTFPAGWTANPVNVQTLPSGREKWTLGAFRGAGVALPAGMAPLAFIQAIVRNSDPMGPAPAYGESHLIDLEVQEVADVNLAEIPSIADDAVHSVNYVGDANRNQTYTSGDITAMQNWIGQSGNPATYAFLPQYLNTDAITVADVNNNSQLTTADVSQVQQEAAGQPGSPLIPAIPPAPPPMMLVAQSSSGPDILTTGGLDDKKKETTIARGLFSNAPIGVLS